MIRFFKEIPFVKITEARKVKPVLIQICEDHGAKLSDLNVVFMSDDALLEINKAHLDHDYYTDIITFSYSEDRTKIEGELYISGDRVRENAEKEGVSFLEELYRIMIHGVLHLNGWEDDTEERKKAMQEAENKYISLLVSRET